LPVTISVNVESVTEGPTLTFSVEETVPLGGGVTDVEPSAADTPVGKLDTPRVTGELKPLIDVTVTVAELDPGRLSALGEIAREKSGPTVGPRVARNVCEHKLLVPPEPVGSARVPVVTSVRVWLFGGVS
jgi:hypothetical protein